jgi:hypothetical protein
MTAGPGLVLPCVGCSVDSVHKYKFGSRGVSHREARSVREARCAPTDLASVETGILHYLASVEAGILH